MADRKSFKQALDEGCEELGEEIGEDIPQIPLLHRLSEIVESESEK